MKLLLPFWLIVMVVGFAVNSPAPVYMKYGDIKGGVTAPGRADWIEILSVAHSLQPVPGRSSLESSLHLTKPVDKASPKLMEHCAGGTVLPLAQLEFMEETPSQVRYFDIRLENVLITSIENSGGTADRPMESLSLNYEKITWTYTTRRPGSRLPEELLSTTANLPDGPAVGATNAATFAVTGIHKNSGVVELEWQGTADRTYDIYAVPNLGGAFSWRGQTTATTDGPLTRTEPILPGTMFFVVEERP
jgi:type VI secretion system secreted protein Hcp